MEKDVLGKKVEDNITRVRGTATGIAHYLHGTTMVRVAMRSGVSEYKEVWFDEQQLEILEEEGD